jgi:hypothetical protein
MDIDNGRCYFKNENLLLWLRGYFRCNWRKVEGSCFILFDKKAQSGRVS